MAEGTAPAERVLIIAEVAQAHDGSLGTAHAYVDAVAKAGADVVKFQTHIAAAESTPHEPWRVRFSPRDETRYEYWKRMEFTEKEWLGLRKHALKVGVDFLSSPFSVEALELLERVEVMGWKVASGEVRNLALLNRMAATGLPVFLSTGMSALAEIDEAVALLQEREVAEITVMQCTSAYPTPPERLGLDLLPVLQGALRLLGGALRPFGGDLAVAGRGDPGCGCGGGPRDVFQVRLRTRRPGLSDYGRARATGRRCALLRAGSIAPCRQGCGCRRAGSYAAAVHEERGRAPPARYGYRSREG